MASYSRKYINASNDNLFVFITWESGYRNLKVYHQGNVVASTDTPREIMSGIKAEIDEFGSLEVTFTKDKPMRLHVEIDGERYYVAEESKKMEAEFLGSIATIFWVLFGFGAIGSFILIYQAWVFIGIPRVLLTVAIDVGVVAIYGVTAFLIARRVTWIYFVGTSVFGILTLTSLWTSINAGNGFNMFFVFIRIVILIMILRHFRKVVNLKPEKVPNADVLDSI